MPTSTITYSYDETTMTASVTGPSTFHGDLNIPSTVSHNLKTYNVTSISDNAFKGGTSITSVTIPDSVTSIGEYAFSNCTKLTSVTLPTNESFTIIADGLFDTCSSLKSITIPDNVSTINEFAFSDCKSLENVTFSQNSLLNTIGQGAFQYTKLTSLNIPVIIQTFDKYALAYIRNNENESSTYTNSLESLTFGGTVDANTPAPTFGSDVFIDSFIGDSLTSQPVIQVPGPSPITGTAFPYSSAIVDAIQNDYQGVTFTINYNAVTTPNGVDYVEQILN